MQCISLRVVVSYRFMGTFIYLNTPVAPGAYFPPSVFHGQEALHLATLVSRQEAFLGVGLVLYFKNETKQNKTQQATLPGPLSALLALPTHPPTCLCPP